MKNNLKAVLAAVLLSGLLGACDSGESNSTVDQLSAEAREAFSAAQDRLNQLAPTGRAMGTKTMDEVNRVFAVEYRVIEFNNLESDGEMERKLNTLGTERWDCFHIERTADGFKFFCKRKPKSYMQYLFPALFSGL